MTYDKEFEEFFETEQPDGFDLRDFAFTCWQAARKDHYRIGEEVEAKQIGAQWKKGTVMAGVYSNNNNYYIEEPERVRRIPAKYRIDEIAEEAEDKYRRGAVGAGSLTDIIKSAILQARKEWEAER